MSYSNLLKDKASIAYCSQALLSYIQYVTCYHCKYVSLEVDKYKGYRVVHIMLQVFDDEGHDVTPIPLLQGDPSTVRTKQSNLLADSSGGTVSPP